MWASMFFFNVWWYMHTPGLILVWGMGWFSPNPIYPICSTPGVGNTWGCNHEGLLGSCIVVDKTNLQCEITHCTIREELPEKDYWWIRPGVCKKNVINKMRYVKTVELIPNHGDIHHACHPWEATPTWKKSFKRLCRRAFLRIFIFAKTHTYISYTHGECEKSYDFRTSQCHYLIENPLPGEH